MLDPKNKTEQPVTLYEFVAMFCNEFKLSLDSLVNHRRRELHHEVLVSMLIKKPLHIMKHEQKQVELIDLIKHRDNLSKEDKLFETNIEKAYFEKRNKSIKSFNSEQNEFYMDEETAADLLPEEEAFSSYLMTQLLSDESLDEFPKRLSPLPTYTHNFNAIGLASLVKFENENKQEFYSYKLSELIEWIFENYTPPTSELSDWVIESRQSQQVPEGFIEIKSLPKLIQLTINAHSNIDWKYQLSRGSKKYTEVLENTLNEEAKKLELESFMDDNDCLSGKLLAQLIRIINPINDKK